MGHPVGSSVNSAISVEVSTFVSKLVYRIQLHVFDSLRDQLLLKWPDHCPTRRFPGWTGMLKTRQRNFSSTGYWQADAFQSNSRFSMNIYNYQSHLKCICYLTNIVWMFLGGVPPVPPGPGTRGTKLDDSNRTEGDWNHIILLRSVHRFREPCCCSLPPDWWLCIVCNGDKWSTPVWVCCKAETNLPGKAAAMPTLFLSPYNSFFYRLLDKHKILSYYFHVKVLFYKVVFVFS